MSMNNQMSSELDGLRTQVEQLRSALQSADQTVAQLKARLKSVEEQRDQYLQSLYALLPDDIPRPTEEEIRNLAENGVPFDVILKDLEQLKDG